MHRRPRVDRSPRALLVEPLEMRLALSALHVATTGDDLGAGTALDPYRTIQRAVDQAAAFNDGSDSIKVAEGAYSTALDGTINIPNSVNIDSLVLQGGYEAGAGFANQDPTLFPTFYRPAAAAGDQVVIQDDAVTISDINFSFDGLADGIVIAADDATLDGISVTGAQNGIFASGRSGIELIESGASNNAVDGVALENVTGTATVTGGIFSNNGVWGLDLDGSGPAATLATDVRIVSLSNTGGEIGVTDFGQLLVTGTNAANTINVTPSQVDVINGPTLTYDGSVDEVVLDGLDGPDTFFVVPSTLTAIMVHGGDPTTLPGDRLTVNLVGVTNPQMPPAGATSGVITSDSHQNIAFTGIERLDAITPDRFEENNSLATATVLGSLPKLTLRDLTIHETFSLGGDGQIEIVPDIDFYSVTAADTGTLIVNLFQSADLAAFDLRVRDTNDNIIAIGATTGVLPGVDATTLVMPVVSQEIYFIEVAGEQAVVGGYDLEIENFAAPRPTAVVLDPNDDSGRSNRDEATRVDTAQLFVAADLAGLADLGIPVLNGSDAAAGASAGAAVEVFANGLPIGFADPVGGSSTLFALRLDATADTDPDVGQWSRAIPIGPDAGAVAADAQGYFNIVTAAVRIFDAQQDAAQLAAPASGRSLLSAPLNVQFDPNVPDVGLVTLAMVRASDGGTSDSDGITAIRSPAFTGVAEANTTIRLFANGQPVGQAVVGSDASDLAIGGQPNDGLGLWEVTVEPLADGDYTITLQVEDTAGNVTAVDAGPSLEIRIASDVPQRPTVDLVGPDVVSPAPEVLVDPITPVDPVPSDTGASTLDNVTRGTDPQDLVGQGTTDVQLRISAEQGSEVIVKDGEAVIAAFTMPAFDFVFLTLDDLGEDPHPISVEAFGVAGNRSAQSEELLLTLDVTPPLEPAAADLLASSDTGIASDDNVTAITAPAFAGLAEANALVRLYATNVTTAATQQIGRGLVQSDETDGAPLDEALNGLGTWEVTVEPLADGVYDITLEVEDQSGNISPRSAPVRVEIDSIAPNTPLLDLFTLSDSGRSDADNVTNDNTPAVTMTSEDPNADRHLLLFEDNLVFRIYDRFEPTAEFLLYDSAIDAPIDAINAPGDGLTALTLVAAALPGQYFAAHGADVPAISDAGGTGVLTDGLHSLKLEVADRAGNLSVDFLLDLEIDTTAPPVTIIAIDPATTDTGVEGYPATLADRVTSDTRTGFVGRAEADAIVRLYADADANGVIDTPAEFSLSVAVPIDGNDAFANGQWNTAFIRDLNDPNLPGGLPLDGVREILVTAEDLAGNVNQVNDGQGDAGQSLNIFIDTQGPQITAIDANTAGSPYDLFDLKPSTITPTPPVTALVISLRDLPNRSDVDANFLYAALFEAVAEQPGHYQLEGDHNGVIPIQSVDYVQDPSPAVAGQPSFGTIQLNFFEPLPDDRFTLTISDALVDPAGNALDGETNATEPRANPLLPTGDGRPGGDFVARLTVDSRPEIGVWSGGSVYIDTNGNFVFDPQGKDNDDTNEDIAYVLGFATDNIFAGNFSPNVDSVADGFDKLAAYGRVGGNFRWLIDTDNNGAPDVMQVDPANVNGLPVAGNFDGDPTNGDEVGVFTGTTWYLDTDHNFRVDTAVKSGLRGLPIVGDFDGDGLDDLATYSESGDQFQFDLAAGGFGSVDARFGFGFPGIREYPVAADMNQDGFDDVGLFAPDRGGSVPAESGEFYFLISAGESLLDRITTNLQGKPVIDFTPEPFGNDLMALFGAQFAVPLVGNFDPPVAGQAAAVADPALFQNAVNPFDVDADGIVAPIDALQVIDDLNAHGARTLVASWADTPGAYLDVDGDNEVSPLDALLVIDALNRLATSSTAIQAVAAPATQQFSDAVSSAAPVVQGSFAAAETVTVNAATPTPVDPSVSLTNQAVAAAGQPAAGSQVAPPTRRSHSEPLLADPLDQSLADIAADIAAAWQTGSRGETR